MATVAVKAPNIKVACAAARKQLGLALRQSLEVLRSGGEDGLYRIHLADGTIVEATIVQRARTEIFAVEA